MAGRGRRAALAWHGYADAEPQTLSRIGFAAIPLATRLAARTICVSDGLAAHIRRRGAPAARVTRIYNPVALATDAEIAQAPALADRAPLALAVGRLAPAKSFATLLRAFARVTHPGARLRIVGEGEERPALEAEIARLGLDERVVLAGRASDMAPHYADARLLALTSTTESFGNVVVEALSRGLPVVGTDCGGPREILDRPGLGALVPVGDEDAIARAIDAAFSEPGDPAPRVARAQDFSIARATDAYERLIEEMIAADADRDRPTPKPA
jgi:glycosyltransferase involved in cell wall biosynthesis